MTVKRFTCDNDYHKGLILKDNLTNEILEEDGIGGYENACDKLNELAEENEQLRIEKGNAQTKHSYELTKKLEYKLKLIDLKKENEQLKSEINMLKTTISRNEEYIDRLTHKGKWRC